MPTEGEKPKILIVDDMPMNLKLLMNATMQLYRPMMANRGEVALQLAEQEHPDLILLDIMMPGMDGYTVCRQLKAQESTRDIPVIFITAMSEETDEMTGLQAGAVDYITKPFSIPLVLARIATHLALRDAYLQMQKQYVALREMEKLRKDVEAITRHDIKSPIDGIIGCSTLLLRKATTLSPSDLQDFHQMILDSARQLREMVNLSLNLVKMEQGQYTAVLQPVDLLPVIHHILKDCQTMVDTKKVEIQLMVEGRPEQAGEQFMVLGDETLCYTMIANLFRNAVEASEVGKPVRLALSSDQQAMVAIHNQGVVPEEIRDRFFDKYLTHGKKGGTGLGTYSARLMAETQKGTIHLESSMEEGTTLTVILCKGQHHVKNSDC